MKTDFILCTKYIYVAEKISSSSFSNIPTESGVTDGYAAQFMGITTKELLQIWDQFKYEGMFTDSEFSTEIEDNYGNMISEISYDRLIINEDIRKKIIFELKRDFNLREKPFIPRDELSSISIEIEKLCGPAIVTKVLAEFSGMVHTYTDKTHTLVDFLFRHSYADGLVTSLPIILAEFLNPIYYSIEKKEMVSKLFEYIDKILSINTVKEDYQKWLNACAKYIKVETTSSKISVQKNKKGGVINQIEFLKKDTGRLKVYINQNHNIELDFGRKKLWGKMYELAENGRVDFNRDFLAYFNFNLKNPLYGNKYNFEKTIILKQEDSSIVPNIKIGLITQKKITQQRNKA
jgi:hypothetical protein